MTILTNIQLAIKLAKMAYDLGHDAKPFVETAYNIAINKKVLTLEEHKSMTDQEATWRADIDKTIAEDDKAED